MLRITGHDCLLHSTCYALCYMVNVFCHKPQRGDRLVAPDEVRGGSGEIKDRPPLDGSSKRDIISWGGLRRGNGRNYKRIERGPGGESLTFL